MAKVVVYSSPPDVMLVNAYPELSSPFTMVPETRPLAEIVDVYAGEFVGTKLVIVVVPAVVSKNASHLLKFVLTHSRNHLDETR